MPEKDESRVVSAPAAGIRLCGVSKEYPAGEVRLAALDRIDLTVAPGEFLAVIGRSGSGKSTLLNMITGIDRPTAGEVWVDGRGLHDLGESRLARWRGRNAGVVFQFYQLMPTLTVLENVLLPMDLCGVWPARERERRARELLGRMEVADQAAKLPAALSGGQQQRAAIARALANDPRILAADEPTGNLDSASAESVFALLASLVREGKTVVLVTHDREIARRAGRIVTLQDGRIVSDVRTQTGVRHE